VADNDSLMMDIGAHPAEKFSIAIFHTPGGSLLTKYSLFV